MTNKHIKIALFASLMVAMILPFSMMDVSAALNENVNEKAMQKGQLYIKDKRDTTIPYQKEMSDLYQVVNDEKSTQAQKNDAVKRMNEIRKLAESLAPEMSTEKFNQLKRQADAVAFSAKELSESENISIVSVGIDHENESVNVAIDRKDLTEEDIPNIEKKLRTIIGSDADITISYADPIYFLSCLNHSKFLVSIQFYQLC